MPDPGTVFGPAVVDDYTVGEPIHDHELRRIEINAPFGTVDMADDLRKWIGALRANYGEARPDGKIEIDAGSYIRWGERLHSLLVRQEKQIQGLIAPGRRIRRWRLRSRMRLGRWLRSLGRRIS